jgi:hypothetical protein
MRLLNTFTLVVEEFFSEDVPEYVILSHTWEQEEVTLQDLRSGRAADKIGYAKIKGCCQKARRDGFTYCWIDTCCIDKTSSAELSEAINSMYRWYEGSCICYVYLSDVIPDEIDDLVSTPVNSITRYSEEFERARWFQRGWTLQELIAPAMVEFYDAEWKEIGTKHSLGSRIAKSTGIDIDVLRGNSPSSCNVATRMSWAAGRQTTRIEDEAYCLLGLFRVNMPLLYGEGRQAFRRLQEEILRVEEDYTLFTWCPNRFQATQNRDLAGTGSGGLLAGGTVDFTDFWTTRKGLRFGVSPDHWFPEKFARNPFTAFTESHDHFPPYLTSRGLRMSLPLLPDEQQHGHHWACITLVSKEHEGSHMLCVLLRRVEGATDRYIRPLGARLYVLPRTGSNFERRSIYIDQPVNQPAITRFYPGLVSNTNVTFNLVVISAIKSGANFIQRYDTSMQIHPRYKWNSDSRNHDAKLMAETRGDIADESLVKLLNASNLDPAISYIHNEDDQGHVSFKYQNCSPAFTITFTTTGHNPRCRVHAINGYDPNDLWFSGLESDRVTTNIRLDEGKLEVKVIARIRRVASCTRGNLSVPIFSLVVEVHRIAAMKLTLESPRTEDFIRPISTSTSPRSSTT